MNIDDLKAAWKEYDRKLTATREINERILIGMIRDRSENRFASVRRSYAIGMLWMLTCLFVSIVVIATNPFDYRYTIQYVPMGIFATGLSILILGLLRSYLLFQKISLTHYNVGESLRRIIAEYEKPKKFMHYTIMIFLFSQVVLLPLSFLPRNIEEMGMLPALVERLIPIGIGALVLFIAFRLGAFKDRHKEKFKEDLDELQSLRKMAMDLSSDS